VTAIRNVKAHIGLVSDSPQGVVALDTSKLAVQGVVKLKTVVTGK
jgi:hypothetical protein